MTLQAAPICVYICVYITGICSKYPLIKLSAEKKDIFYFKNPSGLLLTKIGQSKIAMRYLLTIENFFFK